MFILTICYVLTIIINEVTTKGKKLYSFLSILILEFKIYYSCKSIMSMSVKK